MSLSVKRCSTTPKLLHAEVHTQVVVVGTNVKYTCIPGYYFEATISRYNTISCLENETWTEPNLKDCVGM